MDTLSRESAFEAVNQILGRIGPTSYLDALALTTVGVVSGAYVLVDQIWGKPDPYNYIFYERPQQADGAARAANETTRNIADRMEELGKQAVVFWGSQSGTGEAFASRLVRELAQRFRLDAMAADLSDFDPETITLIPSSKVAIFILSTYGEGDPSDNAGQFWEWATKLKATPLQQLQYAAFGLGNSNYQYYNRIVDVVDESLTRAGASKLLPTGRADDALGSTEEDFLSWKNELYNFCRQGLQLEEQAAAYEPAIEAYHDESLDLIDLFHGEPVAHKTISGESSIGSVQILRSHELFNSTSRNCLHMDIDLSEHPEWTYKTGDHLAIYPVNPDEEVERLIRLFGLTERREKPLCFNSLDSAVHIPVPSPTTINALLRYYVEISAAVSRETVASLIEFAPSESAKKFLAELYGSKEAYSAFLAREHVTLGKLLEMAGGAEQVWFKVPLSYLVETLPRTRPRYYSISSSSVLSPRVASVTALVSNTELTGDTPIPGLTTNYLLALSDSLNSNARPHPQGFSYELDGPSKSLEGAKIFAQLRRSTFKLPALASTPLILAAAGTGIAPFRAFIAERLRLKSMGRKSGEMILFFGCRHPDEDYIYKSELEKMEQELEGKLRIVTAFSRVHGQKKVYVQDKIQELGSDIARLLAEDATLYICGRASMAREIGKTVSGLMEMEREWTHAQAQSWAASMKRGRKWQEDVWG
ncbi:NADP/FAD dependent oxidoreductase [Dactylonectria macrodidyma]|uniref:NADPH--cytochrome P450 reductase n=1 Tax=Dactylonectria macrodidyma TaxID=307937 RepID=A0A9P9ESK2_9HYPO|nr:NADP/FAD dependent oxidoreductase [Dactylonectria macrodidyma]